MTVLYLQYSSKILKREIEVRLDIDSIGLHQDWTIEHTGQNLLKSTREENERKEPEAEGRAI
jgi:hypothetical protein